jgi:hyperosmotically inducible protein
MKKVLMIVMALMISVAFVTTVMAKDKPRGKSWTGEVVSVDTSAKTVVAKNEQGEMTFDVSATKFAKDAKLKDLKSGDKISIKYQTKDGKNMATGLAYATAVKADKSKQEGAGDYVDDSWITTKVKSLLAEDEFLKSFKISVETMKGTVQLTGTVDSQKAVDKAGQIAKSVKGVKSVKNNLIVK